MNHGMPNLALFTFSQSIVLFGATVAFAVPGLAKDERLPSEPTEQWEPVPAVVTVPAETGIPSDAIILFGGDSLEAWEPVKEGGAGWRIEGGAMVVVPESGKLRTKAPFGDIQLHLEFQTPNPAVGDGQRRGNSGVFFMGLYELQILDSYQNPTYVNGQAGAVYKQYAPLVNASRPPGVWQSYDAVFTAPRFTANGLVETPAVLTVFHNGVLVQDHVVLKGPTENRGYPAYRPHAAKLPLELQDHKNPLRFRNIWARPLR